MTDYSQEFADVHYGRPVKDFALYAATVSVTQTLALRVHGPSDPKGQKDAKLDYHLKGCADRGLWALGYVFGWRELPPVTLLDRAIQWFPLNRKRIRVLDLERCPAVYGTSMTTDQAQTFVSESARRDGYACVLYNTEGQSRPGILSRVPQWIARYRLTQPGVPVGADPGQMVAWQHTNGVDGATPHGVPGVSTSCDMNRQLILSWASVKAAWPGRFLSLGATGKDVQRARARLKLSAGTSFDAAMREAVLARQEVAGLVPDGMIGALTWPVLRVT